MVGQTGSAKSICRLYLASGPDLMPRASAAGPNLAAWRRVGSSPALIQLCSGKEGGRRYGPAGGKRFGLEPIQMLMGREHGAALPNRVWGEWGVA